MITQLQDHLSLVDSLFPTPLEAVAFGGIVRTLVLFNYHFNSMVLCKEARAEGNFAPNSRLKLAGSISLRALVLD